MMGRCDLTTDIYRFQPPRGAKEKENETGVYLSAGRWPINQVGWCLFFFFFEIFFMAFLCVSQQSTRGVTSLKTFWGKSMSKAFGRKS
jgi:hypothetical protein